MLDVAEDDGRSWRRLLGEERANVPPAEPDDVAVLFYTSGTTGAAFGNPLARLISRLAQVVPIDLGRTGLSSLAFGAAVLRRGQSLVWFAEGERSLTGDLQPFKPGMGVLLSYYPVPVIPVDRIDDPTVSQRLFREGRLLERLTHPHIVRAYETIRVPRPTLILETLTGETLQHMIETRQRRLPLRGIVHLGLHLCSALHYLHRHNILHLDLKPSNIVSEHGLAKLLDLSIARSPGRGEKGMGTLEYMSPEQASGATLGAAADVWGIGAVLFEATTGEVPFDAYEDEEGRYEQLERQAEPVRHYRRVPAAFDDLVDSCLEPDPALQPTVDEVARSLAAI